MSCKTFNFAIIKNLFYSCFLRDYPMIFDCENVKCTNIDLCPEIYSFLTEFNNIYPHIRSIQFNMGKYFII